MKRKKKKEKRKKRWEKVLTTGRACACKGAKVCGFLCGFLTSLLDWWCKVCEALLFLLPAMGR